MESLDGATPIRPAHRPEKLRHNKGDSITEAARQVLDASHEVPKASLGDRTLTQLPGSSELWEYKPPPIPNPVSGNIQKFRLKDEFDDVLQQKQAAADKKTREMFPAVEPNGLDVCSMLPLRSSVGDAELTYEKQILAALGFRVELRDDGVYLYLPDEKALMANWQALKATHPHLPDLKIGAGEGQAGDMEYIDANLIFDFLLSRDKEFIHDMIVHAVPTLLAMFQPGYSEWRSQVNAVIAKAKERLEKIPPQHPLSTHIDKLKTALGAYVDITSGSAYEFVVTGKVLDIDEHFKTIWTEWPKRYWEQKFNDKNLDFTHLASLWQEVKTQGG